MCEHQPDGRLYCTEYARCGLAAIDPLTDSIVARIPLPGPPRAVASDPVRDRLLVGYSDTLCIVSRASGVVLHRTQVFPDPPCGPPDVVVIHLPQDADFALIGGDAECSADLSVYDCRGDTLTVRTDGWAFPRDAFTDVGAGYSFYAGGYAMLTVDVATGCLVDMVSSGWLEPSFVYADTVNRVLYGWGDCEMSMAVSMDSNVPIGWPPIGEYITGMWADSRTGKLYVADRGLDQVLVLDGRARVTGRLSVGPSPELLTGFGDGRVFCVHGGFVVAIDCLVDSLVMSTERPVSNSVKWMLAAPEVDRLIVAARSVLYVLDPATLAIVGQGDPRGRITGISYDRVRRRVIVACDNGALTALTADSLHQVAAIDLEDDLVDIVVAPTSGRIYGCNEGRDSLVVLDAGDLAVLRSYYLHTEAPLTWDPAYDRVYTTDSRDDLLAIDGRTGKVMPLPCSWGYGMSVWPESGRVYVAAGDGIVVLRDTSERLVRLSAGELPLARTAATVLVGRWFESAGRVSVLDVTGRVVGHFLPGRNDLGAFVPGVYYVRGEDPATATRRIVLLR